MIDHGGGGHVYIDLDEGTVPPGLHAVTEFINNDGIANDFAWAGSQGGTLANCVRASVPGETSGSFAICDTGSHSGKRVKVELLGPGVTDIHFRTEDSGGITEYYNCFKTWNKSGARILGLEVQIGTGDDFVAMDQTDAAHAVLFDENSITRFRLPDGLLGTGGQGEGKLIGVGFLSDQEMIAANPADTTDRATIGTGVGSGGGFIDNPFHVANFGEAILDDSMVPTAILWDIEGTAIGHPLEDGDEVHEVQIAWYDQSKDTWFYGNLGREKITTGGHADPDTFVDLDTRMAALADALGVTVAELGTTGRDGVAVPDEILARMRSHDAFFTDVVEDIRNTNINFVLDVGDLPGGEYTLRVRPIHAEIVENAGNLYQFRVAGNLDGMANVPYLDLGNAATYAAEIDRINGLSEPARAQALTAVGFGFMEAFSGLGMQIGRHQVLAVGRPMIAFGTDGATISSKGDESWAMGQGLRGRVSIHGSAARFDTTASGLAYDVDTYGINAAVEADFDDRFSVGVMVGGIDGEAKAHGGLGRIEASGWSVAAYGRAAFGEGGTVQAIIGHQDLSFDTFRNAPGGAVAKGSTDGTQNFMALQADYMFRRDALTWGPMASVERYRLKVDPFDETGAGAWDLSAGRQKDTITLTSIGLRGEYLLDPVRQTRAHGSLAYTHASGKDQLVGVGFIGLPSAAIPVTGISENWADVTLGVSSSLGGTGAGATRIGAEYRGSFGSDYKDNGLSVFLRTRF